MEVFIFFSLIELYFLIHKVGNYSLYQSPLFAILILIRIIGYSASNVSRTEIPTFKVEPWTGHVPIGSITRSDRYTFASWRPQWTGTFVQHLPWPLIPTNRKQRIKRRGENCWFLCCSLRIARMCDVRPYQRLTSCVVRYKSLSSEFAIAIAFSDVFAG